MCGGRSVDEDSILPLNFAVNLKLQFKKVFRKHKVYVKAFIKRKN